MKKLFTAILCITMLQVGVASTSSSTTWSDGGGGVSFQDAVSTYPNPVVKDLHILISNADFTPTKVQLYDLLGNLVLEQLIFEPEQEIKLDLSEYPSEVYLLQVYDSNGNRITKRIIKK